MTVRNRITKILILLMSFHLMVSISFIFYPIPLGVNPIIDAYRRYFLPGPFFSQESVVKTDLLYFYWSVDGKWSSATNPTLKHFRQSYLAMNPSLLYESRMERSQYEKILKLKNAKNNDSLRIQFKPIIEHYAKGKDIPQQIDSLKIIWVQQTAENFSVHIDTLKVLIIWNYCFIIK